MNNPTTKKESSSRKMMPYVLKSCALFIYFFPIPTILKVAHSTVNSWTIEPKDMKVTDGGINHTHIHIHTQ